ncbi:sulfur oxidation c-type cytochrome SoxX [Magnetococcales bacterium HHB-1]
MKRWSRSALAFTAAAFLMIGCSPSQAKDESMSKSLTQAEDGLPEPLSKTPGDAVRGQALAMNKKKGNCIACHNLPGGTFPGNAGPDLVEAMRDNSRSIAWLRQKIVDPKVDNPDTFMFTFYSNEGKKGIRKDWQGGKRVLNGQEVEDVIAYLLTLRK